MFKKLKTVLGLYLCFHLFSFCFLLAWGRFKHIMSCCIKAYHIDHLMVHIIRSIYHVDDILNHWSLWNERSKDFEEASRYYPRDPKSSWCRNQSNSVWWKYKETVEIFFLASFDGKIRLHRCWWQDVSSPTSVTNIDIAGKFILQ